MRNRIPGFDAEAALRGTLHSSAASITHAGAGAVVPQLDHLPCLIACCTLPPPEDLVCYVGCRMLPEMLPI
jgi:hypothetical protein